MDSVDNPTVGDVDNPTKKHSNVDNPTELSRLTN